MKSNNILKFIKMNLSGKFLWNSYVKHSAHDHKFGPNFVDYVAQIPVVGLAFVVVIYIFLYLVIAAVRPFQIYHDRKDQKFKKVLE